MIAAVNVTTSATEILPANIYRLGVIIQNLSDTDIYLSLIGPTPAVTTSNGLKLEPGRVFTATCDKRTWHSSIHAIHGGTGDKEVRVQEIEEVR